MRREDAHFADLLADNIAGPCALKVPFKPFRTDLAQKLFRVSALTRKGERRIVNVGCKYLHRYRDCFPLQMFPYKNGQRIHFLARGAGGNPDAHRVPAIAVGADPADHLCIQCGERLRIAKEIRDADQQIAKERGHLLLVTFQQRAILLQIADLTHLHTARDAAKEGLAFVAGKIMPRLFSQDVGDGRLHLGLVRVMRAIRGNHELLKRAAPVADLDQLGRHFRGGQGEIDKARRDGTLGHFRVER